MTSLQSQGEPVHKNSFDKILAVAEQRTTLSDLAGQLEAPGNEKIMAQPNQWALSRQQAVSLGSKNLQVHYRIQVVPS
jgi:hypothetical protein